MAILEAVSQVVLADLIVLTKTDVADSKSVERLRARLGRLNRQTRIVDVDEVRHDPKVLWGCSLSKSDVTSSNAKAWLHTEDGAQEVAEHMHHHGISNHESKVETASITIQKPLDATKLKSWLDELAMVRGEDVLRIKGLIFLTGQEAPVVFHAVQHLFDGPITLNDWSEDKRDSKVTIIAKNMSKTRLERTLNKLAA